MNTEAGEQSTGLELPSLSGTASPWLKAASM